MAIKTDEYVKYDANERFYYLTESGMVEYTGYEKLSKLWGKATEKTLIKMGRQLKRLISTSGYNGKKERHRHIDIIEYNIFKNQFGERQAIIDALVMMVELEYDLDWFRKLLNDEVKWTKSITSPLHTAGLYGRGELLYCVPEDEYRKGY